MSYILAIDAGTTSIRAVIFDDYANKITTAQQKFSQSYPQNGWVEHDPEEIWQTVLSCCKKAISQANLNAANIKAIGITNQRETTIIWNKKTGAPVYPAIVWQDRRTIDLCEKLQTAQTESMISEKTGLLLDPYFCATKIKWILDHTPHLYQQAEEDLLCFGTVDSFLLFKLTGGASHKTDVTNASRTLLYNIHRQAWDDDLIQLFDIPRQLLPTVCPNTHDFGETHPSHFGSAIPITAMIGDQQSACVGQACIEPGMIKTTYGSGGFVLLNSGDQCVQSTHRLLSTILYQIDNTHAFALEGSIFSAGTTLQWLGNSLHFFKDAADTCTLAQSVKDTNGVYFVPAFTGLGAPYWDPNARALISGLTRDTNIAHIVRASLDALCYQTNDLIQAIQADYNAPLDILRIDGGMAYNDYLLQFLADILSLTVERAKESESTVWGAGFLAGLGAGIYKKLDDINQFWTLEQSFQPKMSATTRSDLCAGWEKAINRTVSHPL